MIVDLDQLRKLSGLKRPSEIRKWLAANGITFMLQASGDPVTTMDAINRAMYVADKYAKPDMSEPTCSRQKFVKSTAATTSSTRENGIRSPASMKARPRFTEPSRRGRQTGPQPTGNS